MTAPSRKATVERVTDAIKGAGMFLIGAITTVDEPI